jgi:hypothetical protein
MKTELSRRELLRYAGLGAGALLSLPLVSCNAVSAHEVSASLKRPYVDPSQLGVPWPLHSHYRIPWRAWLEPRAAYDFAQGIGMVFNHNLPAEHDALVIRTLAEAGVRAVRREVGWGSVRWDETGLIDEARFREQLRLFRHYGLRPTLLLNCHHGNPCPLIWQELTLLADAPAGATRLKLAEIADFIPGRTGLSHLSDYWAAEVLLSGRDPVTGDYLLAKPLPVALSAGPLEAATLKYLPFYPLGTPEFEETLAGWLRYAELVGAIARDEGLSDFDVEIYNELTFGFYFLDIGWYLPDAPPFEEDPLQPGGSYWEIARRTVALAKRALPGVRTIWGFSNTTFFHTAVSDLPPGIDGQSYHPYGTHSRDLRAAEPHQDRPEWNLEGYTPDMVVHIPEGVASTLIQTESIMRLLAPSARQNRPPETARFYHYMTEHGVNPAECAIDPDDDQAAWALQRKCLLRSYCLWLHKGIDVLHYYSSWYAEPRRFGLLPAALEPFADDATFEQLATPPLQALRRLTRALADAKPLTQLTALEVAAEPMDEVGVVFEGPEALSHAAVLAVLPWQLDARRFVAAVYVATWDATQNIPEERYRLTIPGAAFTRFIDLVTGAALPIKVAGDSVTLPVDDLPRLLFFQLPAPRA